LTHLPGKVTYKEIDEMIKTVDENGDGKINYQVIFKWTLTVKVSHGFWLTFDNTRFLQ